MSRLNRLAFASALVLAAGSALAYEPELGFEYTPAPAISLGAPADRAAPSSPAWEPEIAGLGADAYAVGSISQEPADPLALLDPGFGPGLDLVATSSAAPAATAVSSTGSGAGNGQLAQNCTCK